jgi:CheY-like chemotaxis protein
MTGPVRRASDFRVDDDESMRAAARTLLRSAGYQVRTFASAEDLLDSGAIHKTECLILDVRMPGMDCLELQRRLHAEGFRVPIDSLPRMTMTACAAGRCKRAPSRFCISRSQRRHCWRRYKALPVSSRSRTGVDSDEFFVRRGQRCLRQADPGCRAEHSARFRDRVWVWGLTAIVTIRI